MLQRIHLTAVALSVALVGTSCTQNQTAASGASKTSEVAPTSKPTTPKASGPASAPAQRVALKLTGLAPLSPAISLEAPARSKLQALVAGYMTIGEALVASNVKATREAAASAQTLIDGVPAAGLPPDAAAAWTQQSTAMRDALKVMSNAEADLVAQRFRFARLSEAVYAAARSFDLKGSFVQFCPMANDNAGAIWLSSAKEIKNPYFGEAMLMCGETKEQI